MSDATSSAASTTPRIARLLGLVRRLIDYGRNLADTLRRAAAPDFASIARPFGTSDVALILARITAGLCRAAALEAALLRRADRGRDVQVAPIRLPTPRGPRVAPVEPASRNHQPAGPLALAEDPRLAALPTAEQIAEERRRPIGAVIVDICHDLGIAPGGLDRAFWDEIFYAIAVYGGSLVRFHDTLHARVWAFCLANPLDTDAPAWPVGAPPSPATGPP